MQIPACYGSLWKCVFYAIVLGKWPRECLVPNEEIGQTWPYVEIEWTHAPLFHCSLMSLRHKRSEGALDLGPYPSQKKKKGSPCSSIPTVPTLEEYLHKLLSKLVKGEQNIPKLLRKCRLQFSTNDSSEEPGHLTLNEGEYAVSIIAQALRNPGGCYYFYQVATGRNLLAVRVPWDAEEYSGTAKATSTPLQPLEAYLSKDVCIAPAVYMDNKDRIILWYLPDINLPHRIVSDLVLIKFLPSISSFNSTESYQCCHRYS